MILISQDQWDAIEINRRIHFVDAVARYLCDRFNLTEQYGVTPESIRGQIEKVLAQGEQWGLKSSYSLFQHVLISRIIGHDYADAVPVLGQVVRSTHLEDKVKGQFLENWLSTLERLQIGVKPKSGER